MNERKIIEKLNKLTILDITENYNKSEYERIILDVENTDEIKRIKEEIKNILEEYYNPEQYFIRISCNHVSIDKIIERRENCTITTPFKQIYSDNFSRLPYAYVMGKKISKKAMLNFVSNEKNIK